MDTALFDLFVDSFWQILLPGLTVTIPLTAIAFSGALVIAVVVALIQYAHVPVLKDLARLYIWATRGTPLLVQLFVVFYGLPHAGVLINPFVAAVVVFAVNEGAYCAETIRAALESVPAGQLEAGLCSGMSYLQTIARIVLPQAFRTAFPTLGNSLIAMVNGQHHRHGNVHDNAAHRGTHLRTFVALCRGRLDLPHFLHGPHAPSELQRKAPENLCLPLRQRNIACC